MNPSVYASILANLKYRVSLWMIIAGMMAIGNILLAVLAITMNKPERIIVIPPEIRQKFWVEGSNVSPSYLIEMGRYLAHDLYTYNPESAEGQFDEFLKYTDPEVNGAMRRQLKLDLDQIKSKSLASVFWPRQIKAIGNTVYLYGTQRSMMAGALIGDALKGYRIEFKFTNHLFVTAMREVQMPVGGIEDYERNEVMKEKPSGIGDNS